MTYNWQEILVAIILLGCAILIGRKTYLFFRRVQKKENPCDGCVSGCDLKRQLDAKRKECASSTAKPSKQCCG